MDFTTKTYAVKAKDYLGAEYTIGYVLARDTKEAEEKALDIRPSTFVQEIETQDQMTRAIDDMIDAANAEASRRIKGVRS